MNRVVFSSYSDHPKTDQPCRNILTWRRAKQVPRAGRAGGERARHRPKVRVQVGKRSAAAGVDQRLHGRIVAHHLPEINTEH